MSTIINDIKAEIWLTHFHHKQNTFECFPLGIGHVASYTRKVFPNRYSFKLFIDPDKFAGECHSSKPLIVGIRNEIGISRMFQEPPRRPK